MTIPSTTTSTTIQTTTTLPLTTTMTLSPTTSTTTSSTITTTTTTIQELETVFVSKVIDGDTIELQTGEKVRLLEINTAEAGQPCSEEATNRLRELVEGKQVSLEKDVTDKDMYGRLLRYIFVDDLFVNKQMVKEGLANSYIYGNDKKYEDEITQAENYAKENQIGCLWQPSNSCSNCIEIITFHYDADGNDNYNLNDEYVTFKSTCSYSCDMTDWTVKDEGTHIFAFPTFNLDTNQYVTLYSGSGTNTNTQLYWQRSYGAIWNNDEDTLYLRDKDGNLVLEYSY